MFIIMEPHHNQPGGQLERDSQMKTLTKFNHETASTPKDKLQTLDS